MVESFVRQRSRCEVDNVAKDRTAVMGIDVDLNGKKILSLETVRRDIIPAKGRWASELKAGQFIKVTDPCGKQAADFWAFNAEDVYEHLSAAHTRVWVNRLCPVVGESFHSNRRRPI